MLDHKEQQGHAIVDVKQALSDRSGEFSQVSLFLENNDDHSNNKGDLYSAHLPY